MPHDRKPPYDKSITLMGMSGVGKSYFSMKLAEWGWHSYSCDVEIGKDLLGVEDELQPDDIRVLMEYLGLLGDPSKGGILMDEFIKRQKFYKISEMLMLLKLAQVIDKSRNKKGIEYFVNDSTGSLCEITDEDVIDYVGDVTKIVYIKASGEEEAELLQRAQDYPKPIYYPPEFFQGWVEQYLSEQGLSDVSKMDPQGFARWVFPLLLESRKPKYQAIADKHGITITSAQLQACETEAQFKELVGL